MKPMQRTAIFAGVAVLSLVVAIFASPSRSRQPAEFGDVGSQFYPDFHPTEAKELRVVAYNPDTATAKMFDVAFKNGAWRIPSRYDYPADGKDRLAKTAASVIGISRDALAGRFESQHEEFGVIDPTAESTQLKGRGQRITLQDEKGKVLADYIIGKQVEERPGHYYIRRPDEKLTYIAKLNIDLSTKFTDWIEDDLLKLDAMNLVRVNIDRYSINEQKGEVTQEDLMKLARKNSTDPWKLEGLNEETEQVNTSKVQQLVNELDNLKIVGVRLKPARLSSDLKLMKGMRLDQRTVLDLQDKGFMLAATPDGGQQLMSNEGDLLAATNDGVEYLLRFGEVFTGNTEEIEVGFASDQDKDESQSKKEEEKPKEGLKKSRYIFVTAHFDESAVGEPPKKPEEPTKPEGYDEQPEQAATDPNAPADALLPENNNPRKQYDQALAKYKADQAKYEQDLKSFNEKAEKGKERVKELNARFADWYYVVSAESFENLHLSRKDLVEPKQADANPNGQPNSATPSITPPGLNLQQ